LKRQGQVVALDNFPLADDQSMLNDIFQLPDVAGKIVIQQNLHGVVGKIFSTGIPGNPQPF